MEYTLEMAERMAEKLRALPAIDAGQRRLNKQKLVAHLKIEIAGLQERGYTIEQVAESLRGVGLDITTPTLKSYLQRTKKKLAKARKGPPRSGRPTARPQEAPTQASAEEPPSDTRPEAPAASPKSTRGEFIVSDRQRL